MLSKDHGKPPSLCHSWRCISTCLLVPKSLNLYISDPHRVLASASAQFMTRGSSHELAKLLLTETICYTTLTWILLLEHILSEAFSAADDHADQSLVYMTHRLTARRTFLQFSSTLMDLYMTGEE